MNTKAEINSKSCASCRHWDQTTNTNEGSCRRNAPQTVVFQVSSEQTIKTVFPSTKATDWCGEHSLRNS